MGAKMPALVLGRRLVALALVLANAVAGSTCASRVPAGYLIVRVESEDQPGIQAAIDRAMRDAFAATDARIIEEAGTCGCTATVALILGNALCIANIGDSRSTLAPGPPAPLGHARRRRAAGCDRLCYS